MILTGSEIKKEVKKGRIVIDPFNIKDVETNSYDFHIDNVLYTYKDDLLDPTKDNELEELVIPTQGLTLSPKKIYIGRTIETIGSKYFVPIIKEDHLQVDLVSL